LGQSLQSPFKSDVYFSPRTQTDQHWGTPNPITIRDKEFAPFASAASAFIPIT
jgi:membrane protease subunit (stomatin/prohibitin family)